ncbi:ASCH domain-containing protein [Paucibacter sp. O1-1]|nr:ASCH domain-containing protein [Paucibacter sp. O1-1]MDA3825465.1 ASCH domain-containing protein [Paucibacter sp. O1-1]
MSSRFYEAFSFSDNPQDADALALKVLNGSKTGTSTLLWSLQTQQELPPARDALSVVTDGAGRPLCVIETTSVQLLSFDAVTAEFAASEGEGDLSLAHWQRSHWDYFSRECARLGREACGQMPVVCERFRLVYAAKPRWL